MTEFSYQLEEINQAAKTIIETAGKEMVWVFQGDMGAGKTTMVKALAELFGISDQVSSPTFGIINHYENMDRQVFYHFDFYRLEDPTEALDIGIDEYFYSGNYCWLEWAEKIGGLLPDSFLLIKISTESETKRTINLQLIGDAN